MLPLEPSHVFTVSFYKTPSGELRGAQLTHENLTAGITAIRALFPTSGALSSLDTIISSHSLSSAYGRAVAYAAIYEGTSFATVASSNVIGSNIGMSINLSKL
jgi:long-chain acyl-CoA synthetase